MGLVLASNGKAVSQNRGLSGGHPGNTGLDIVARQSRITATDAGPQIIATAADYVDAPVVFRQYCCPSCWTALYSAAVPAGHVDAMSNLVLTAAETG